MISKNYPIEALIKTCTDSSIVYYSILVETSLRMSAYNAIIKTFIIQLQKINRDCKLQIITFDEIVDTVFKFETDPILLIECLKEIVFFRNEKSNFGHALYQCYKNIEPCRQSKNISKIIIFSSGKSTDESEDELVDILSLDNNTIFGFACGTNSDEVVKDLQSLLPYQDILPLNKSPSKDDLKSLMSRINDGINFSSSTKCPVNIEVYPHSTETRSIKEDILLDVIIEPIKVGAGEVVIPPGTKIQFLSNSYCSSCTIILANELKVGQKYNEMVTLQRKKFDESNQLVSTPDFPSKIYFTIEFKNENKKVNIHEGFITLNISYFLGELKSKKRCCIGVEGSTGDGKSALLNGFANLFNPTNELEEYFISDPSDSKIATTIYKNTSLKEILSSKKHLHPVQESFHDIDIAWSDNWGFIYSDVPLECKAEGRIHNGISMKDCNDGCSIKESLDKFRVNCFIFVMSCRGFGNPDVMERYERKMREVIDLGITPLLAITFVNLLTKNQYKESIKYLNRLPVEKCNTFIINNYHQNQTRKDTLKDIQYLKLLTRAVELCK
ncbi:hypothetical protein ACTFIW_009974 [Dictyostelium discoideum]